MDEASEARVRRVAREMLCRTPLDHALFDCCVRMSQIERRFAPTDVWLAGIVDGDGHVCAKRRSEEHTSELQSPCNLVCRLLLENKYARQGALHEYSTLHHPYHRTAYRRHRRGGDRAANLRQALPRVRQLLPHQTQEQAPEHGDA